MSTARIEGVSEGFQHRPKPVPVSASGASNAPEKTATGTRAEHPRRTGSTIGRIGTPNARESFAGVGQVDPLVVQYLRACPTDRDLAISENQVAADDQCG